MADRSLADTLENLIRSVRERKLESYKPYPFQKRFHALGKDCNEVMLMAANRVGKTEGAAAEVAYHATGDYPSWWDGRRLKAKLVWVGSVTNEASRDIVQKALLGGMGEDLGTGTIPKSKIVGKPSMRQAGISDVVDTLRVRHRDGHLCYIIFKTYDQGWRKWQGTEPDVVWLDEEPGGKEGSYRIYTECQTRIMTSKGLLLVTFTPLLGETELVLHFTNPATERIGMVTATWDDAPHLGEKDKADLKASYPDYELEARTEGIPMMGSGRVFAIDEKTIKIPPRDIPRHWPQITGIDFGIDHPAAGAKIAWDRDQDVIYLTDCYRKANETPVYHAARLKRWGGWPVSWPHDGMNRGKADGKPLKDQYRSHGVPLLAMSARYENDVGGAQPVEPIVMDMLERMKTGGFFAFDTCTEFFEEFRGYHRKDGKIVPIRDDILKALFYAVMMKRFARVQIVKQQRRVQQPVFRMVG